MTNPSNAGPPDESAPEFPAADGSDLEPAVRDLVHAASSPLWMAAVRVLFLNGSVLEFVEDAPVPVLVSLEGRTEGVGHFMELAKTRLEADVSGLASTVVNRFAPQIQIAIREFQSIPTENTHGFAMAIGARMAGELEGSREFIRQILGEAIQGAVSLSQGVSAIGFEALNTRRIETLRNSLSPNSYEEMIARLLGLGLIEPRLRVALCGSCGNYEFVVTTSSKFNKACAKCGADWAVLTLFVFKAPFDSMKKNGRDLPVFIAAFLRSRIQNEFMVGSYRIHPLARFGKESDAAGEIDVWIPSQKLGIEAKTYEDALAPFTRGRTSGLVKSLDEQLERYYRFGVRRLVLTTNLSEGSAAKLKSALVEHWKKKDHTFKEIEVLSGNPERLVAFLNDTAKKAGKELEKQFVTSVKPAHGKALPGPMTQEGARQPRAGRIGRKSTPRQTGG